MSDDKKRDRALQRRVRERQAKTGESYQAAWQQLTEGNAPKQSSTHDLGNSRRVPLSLGTGLAKVPPSQSAQVTVRPQLDSFWPVRLLIKNANRWDIHRLAVGNWDLDDAEYHKASLIEEVDSCSAEAFSLDTWHPLISREVRCGQQIVAVVTYTGPREQGECFEAALFGWEGCPPAKSTEHHDAHVLARLSERAESKIVRADETIKLPLTITSPALFVDRLTIANAKDWVVNDILTRGKSIFVQSGDLPGEMFSDSARVILEPLAADDRVDVVATYIGNKTSARLVVELSGTAKSTSDPREDSYFLPMSTGTSILPTQSDLREVSYFLPMSTGTSILPTQSAQITARPQKDFLPERLVIADPDKWIVNDITIGVRHQLAALGDLPGQSFASRAVGSHLRLDPVRAGQEFVMVTTLGEDYESTGFCCGVQGRLVGDR